ncbi:MAG: tricarballylate utilization 4Fe-4S protein TcuB [Alphaproteobacteria bacterium]|nr:tricarballylate utilization 4Fe-4S protein TcuB [Alphaproteobacteria bacterium]
MPWSDPLTEAERQFTICNACRYCEGHCAVFPAMELRRTFSKGDLGYLANLCHDCRACYHHCQYAPPHEFAVNLPRVLSQLRTDTYIECAWPRAFAQAFRENGVVTAMAVVFALVLFIMAAMFFVDGAVLYAAHTGEGAFYQVISHEVMVWTFGAAFGYALFAMAMGYLRFRRITGDRGGGLPSAARAGHDAARLTYLHGGGTGCTYPGEAPTPWRRWFHHMTAYGFLLCFAATSVATVYHYVFGWIAPYGWTSWPVILGTLGGIGLIVGPAGLLALHHQAMAAARKEPDDGPEDPDRMALDTGFAALLIATSATGLALLLLRETAAMGMLLVVHLGIVMALFVTLPYGKFVHGLYRFAALKRHAREQAAAQAPGMREE